jgi:hypothetical protein
LQEIGDFFSGIGPLLMGSIAIYGAAHYLVGPSVFSPLGEVQVQSADLGSVEAVKHLWSEVYPASTTVLRRLFSPEHLRTW